MSDTPWLRHAHRSAVGTALPFALALLMGACSVASPSPPASSGQRTSPTPTPSAEPSPTPEPTPSRAPLDEGMLHRRLTVLVVGEDSDRSREAAGLTATNTDAIMVVSLNATQSQIVMLSLPRDTVDIPMPNGSLYRGKVNGIMRDFGLEALRGAMATLLGIGIDGYLKIDMDNFVQLVDAVGGVDVEVQTTVSNARLGIHLEPGPAHLTGALALAYTRSRQDSDYARDARQQQVLLALVRKFVDPATDWSVESLLPMMDSLQTDLDLGKLPTMIQMGRRSQDAAVVATVLRPPRFALFEGIEGTQRGWVMIPNVAEMRSYAQELIGD